MRGQTNNHKLGTRIILFVWTAIGLTMAILVLNGCASDVQAMSHALRSPESLSGTAVSTATMPMRTALPTTISKSTPSSETSDVIWPVSSSTSSGSLFREEVTLDGRIDTAEVVARVKLLSVSTPTYRQMAEHHERGLIPFYIRPMEFKFEVLEYLKGSGSNTMWGVVPTFVAGLTEKELSNQPDILAIRDKYLYSRWDEREAIVFLQKLSANERFLSFMYPVTELIKQPDRYYLGDVGSDFESYSIASPFRKNWLPSAQPSGVSGASGDAQQFLLDAPGGYDIGSRSGGLSGASEEGAPTITLSALKSKIAAMEITATPTSTPAPSPMPAPTPTYTPTP